jgi:hypothetical protein
MFGQIDISDVLAVSLSLSVWLRSSELSLQSSRLKYIYAKERLNSTFIHLYGLFKI